MSGMLRRVVVATALALVAVACGGTKDTGLPEGPTPEPTVKANTVEALASNVFAAKEIKVKVGTEVTWEFVSVLHNAVADDGSFNSHPGCVSAAQDKCSKVGDTYKFKFTKAGEVPYYCAIHGFKGGLGMAGKVLVEA